MVPTPLGDTSEFALECEYHERDDGIARETLSEKVQDPFSFVEFVGDVQNWIVHRDPHEPDYVIEAELEMVESTEAHSVAESIAKALSGTGLYVVNQHGTRDYYIVSEVEL